MLDQRVMLSVEDLHKIPADVLVIEDNGWLTASRGLAAMIDSMYPELRPHRERALEQHGGPYPIGSAVAFRLPGTIAVQQAQAHATRGIVWAITFSYEAANAQQASNRIRATPLDVAAATRSALQQAAGIGAQHVVMPALGTRLEHHVLPPTPKKLPRYVMAAAQLIGLQQALAEIDTIERVTISVTQRDHDIFLDVLGKGTSSDGVNDD